jgi:hypothetical protein
MAANFYTLQLWLANIKRVFWPEGGLDTVPVLFIVLCIQSRSKKIRSQLSKVRNSMKKPSQGQRIRLPAEKNVTKSGFDKKRTRLDLTDQGCQMVYFHTKNPDLDILWRVLKLKMLVYFMTICNNLRPFGIPIYWPFGIVCIYLVYIFPVLVCLDQEKSGSPVTDVFETRIEGTKKRHFFFGEKSGANRKK